MLSRLSASAQLHTTSHIHAAGVLSLDFSSDARESRKRFILQKQNI